MVPTPITIQLNMIHFKNHCTYIMLIKSEIERSKRYYCRFVISITV